MRIQKIVLTLFKLKTAPSLIAVLTFVFICSVQAQMIMPVIDSKLPSGEIDMNASDQELAEWAWKQFIALGWESTYTEIKPERGIADTNWTTKTSVSPTVAVWETFAHRQELRPWNAALTGTFADLGLPNYKIGSILKPALKSTNFKLLNNLDEDNEIDSALVYLGKPDNIETANLILYQAKVNSDEYDYIAKTFPDQYDPNGSLAKAAKNNTKNMKLHKTSVTDAQGLPIAINCSTPAGVKANKYIILPCGTKTQQGAIEIKTAFMKIDDIDVRPNGPYKDFLIRDAIYYTVNADKTYTYHNGKFALLGIHIIRKTEQFPGFIFTSFEHKSLEQGLTINGNQHYFHFKRLAPSALDYGGFVNPDKAKAKELANGTAYGSFVKIERQNDASVAVSDGSLYPVASPVELVNSAYQGALAAHNSIWANYRLIGVQAQPTTSYGPDSLPGSQVGANHFMANFIIESDSFLGNFFGPGFLAKHAVFPKGPRFSDHSKNGDNVVKDLKSYNMGGCKGCHGVAATAKGTDTSFLLDFGAGKPIKKPDTIHYSAD